MTRNPSGKVQIITQPQSLPATCGMCGKPPGRVGGREIEFADFGMSFEFYGSFILCDECIWEIADTMGCVNPILSKVMIEEKAQSIERIAELEGKVEELERVLSTKWFTGTSDTGTTTTSIGTSTPVKV